MLEGLDEMSMLSDEQVDALNLFGDSSDETDEGNGQDPSKENPDNDPSKEKPAEEEPENFDPENLFGGDDDGDEDDKKTPESVGSKKDKGNTEDAPSTGSTPPYSSLAKALKEDGISGFSSLEDSDIEKVQNGEDFEEVFEKAVQSRLDEKQRRIDEALNSGVEPTVIQQYEHTIEQLDSITAEQLESEDERGENLRKNILYKDYLDKGFTKERAERAVNQAVSDGTDIEDAKEALESIKKGIRAQYQAKLDEAKAEEDAIKQEQAEQAKTLRKSLLEDKELFGDLEVDKAMRQKALDAIIKPVHQDPETGQKFTAIQMYERENRVDFLKKIGLIYAMTDGFKTLDGLVGKKVKKEVGKGMRALEDALNGTRRKADGSVDFAGGNDPESSLGFTLDL